jgi:hypothetical protein
MLSMGFILVNFNLSNNHNIHIWSIISTQENQIIENQKIENQIIKENQLFKKRKSMMKFRNFWSPKQLLYLNGNPSFNLKNHRLNVWPSCSKLAWTPVQEEEIRQKRQV